MKRFLLSILMVVIGLSAFSQSPSRLVSLYQAYPAAIGENTIDGVTLSNSGFYMYDILQDSLPFYEIGQIDAQTVSYTEDGHGFYVKADTLHSLNVIYSYEVDELPKGTIEFNEATGRFKYYPAAEDYKSFYVTFTATNGNESVSEKVQFSLLPQTLSEISAFQTQGVMPSASDYTIIAEDSIVKVLNYENRMTRGVSISGKDIVFDDNVQNKVWSLNGRKDIYELNVFAERVVVRSSLSFPQTNITIYAKELVFEDHDGVFASINTSPSSFEIMSKDNGQNGANAGNITLYIKDFKGDVAKRLILNGAQGQNTNRNGTPGNGGNGGIVTSTIDIREYCDFTRGGSGVRFDVASDGSFDAGVVISSGNMGAPGRFDLIETPYAYLHSNYVSAILRLVNDAYINNFMEYSLQTCREYRTIIEEYKNSAEWESCDSEEQAKLQNNLTEIGDILFKLEQGLDYFGNPIGWVPLLSFEVMLNNYDNEIDRAIPTLYMNYWLSRVNHTLENMFAATQLAVSNKEQDIENWQKSINNCILKIPVLQDQIKELEAKIEIVNQKIEIIEAELMAKARHNVKKKNRIKKACSITKSIASAVSVCGPWGAAIGGALSTATSIIEGAQNVTSNIAYATKTFQEYAGGDTTSVNDMYNDATKFYNKTSDFLKQFGSVNLTVLDSIVTNIPWKEIGKDPQMLKKQFDSFSKAAEPLITNAMGLAEDLSHGSTPQDQVNQVFQKLCNEHPELQSLKADLEKLNLEKSIVTANFQQTMADIVAYNANLSDGMIALDGLKRDVFNGNSKRDLNAMQYLAKMEQQAKIRLLKYHYYMRKAYEYRLLKPYKGEFNLVGMFERFESMGMVLGDVIDESAYASLSSIFREAISDMAEMIIDEYSVNYPEQSAPITIVIPKEQLDVINSDEQITLNFHDMGIFAPDEENVRIVNLGVQHIESHTDGNVGYSGYMDLNLTHSGISQFRKDGQIYWFDHMSRTSTSPHTWGIRYDAVSKESTTIQPSAASSSLIASLIGTGDNIMLFSRPSGWSDLALSKKVHTSGGADIVIDSLVLRLQYDFTRRPNSIRNIDVTANENLLPYIACSDEDINGRSNGNGNLYRSYALSTQPVKFTAIEQYGTYYFTNWTDKSGKVVSEKPELLVNKNKDQFYKANYVRRPPILNVPDTIWVAHDGGIYNVHVGKKGFSNIEMDWWVSDSLSTWVHLNDEAEGIDEGYFTFSFDINESQAYRVDSLEIFAPETGFLSKKIYIAQVDNPYVNIEDVEEMAENIRIYPNPMQKVVIIDGNNISTVNIISLAGKDVYQCNVNGKKSVSIDVGNLSAGMYIISVKAGNSVINQKVVKTK